jgi:magnesium transporter
MLLELKFSIWTLGLGAGTFIAALYGMNLKNFIEESDSGFFGVSIACAVASVVVLVYGLKILRRVQKVSMWGGAASGGLPSGSGLGALPSPGSGAGGGFAERRVGWAREALEMREECVEAVMDERRRAVEATRHFQGPLWSKGRATGKKEGEMKD